LLCANSEWDSLRGDERFEKLVEEANKPVALKIAAIPGRLWLCRTKRNHRCNRLREASQLFAQCRDSQLRFRFPNPNNSAQFSPCSLLPTFLLAGRLNPRKRIGQTHLSSQAPLIFPEEFRSKARSNS
jgi:hypothetical protein